MIQFITRPFAGRGRIGRLALQSAAALLVAAIGTGTSPAQQESQADRAMRKAQAMLRQLASEKKALEIRAGEAEAEVAKAKAELTRAQAEIVQQQSVQAGMAQHNAALVERIRSDHHKMQGILARLKAAQAELRLYEQDHALLKNVVIERNEWIAACRKSNAELIAAGKELLVRYNDKSLWDSIVAGEPVLGIGGVDQEVEDQEYRFRLEDLRVRPLDSDAALQKPREAEEASRPEDSTAGSGD